MKLSIIIPVYNCENYIEECIKSILDKIDFNISELIIINDGSTDNTKKLLEKYNNIKNMFIYNNENHGVSYSRNFGILKATGKYIMFVDSDDYLYDNWFVIYDIINTSNYDLVYLNENQIEYNLYNQIKKTLGMSFSKYYATIWSKLYSRKFLLKNDIEFRNSITHGEDMIFNIECNLKSSNIFYYVDSIYFYRENFESVTHVINNNIFANHDVFKSELLYLLNNYSIDIKFIDNIMTYLDSSFIISILHKLYYVEKKKEKREIKNYLLKLNNYSISNKYLKFDKRLLLFFYKKKFYALINIFFKIKLFLKKILLILKKGMN